MSDTTIWKVKASIQWSTIAKGMEVEVVVKNRTNSKPNVGEIKEALERKYSIKVPGGMSTSIFEFTRC